MVNQLPPAAGDTAPLEGGAVAAAAGAFNRLPPTALILLSIVSVQLGAALATVLFSSLGPGGTAFVTSLLSAATLSLVRGRRGAPSLARARRHLGLVLLFGLVYSAMALPFFLALERIPLGVLSTVTFLGPLGLAVATSRRPVHFACIGIAVLGVALLAPDVTGRLAHPMGSGGAGALDPLGLLFAAIGGIGWAAFVPMSKRAGAVFPGSEGLALALWASAAMLLPFALFEGGILDAGIGDLAGAFGVSLLGTVLPMAMEYRALQRMSARAYGILVTLEPAVGALVGVLCLGQPAGARMVIAVACVMLAALGVTLTEDRPGGR